METIENSKQADSVPDSSLPPLTLLHCLTFYPAPEEEY
ncbi:MAG: hypothetical protein UHY90_05770, partial [Treponema sp.]|nr:hypothetical protein [Treponema sp.]